jgi:sugar/nucleoside kinase (ribokinase family)
MRLAKENKAMVSIALGSYELVRAFKGTLIDILSKYVDIIFANEAEAKELYPGSAEDAVDYLATLSHIAVVTCGKKGCWIKCGEQKYYVPVKTVAKHKVVDTTGAGDVFASGFLYGYLQGYALDQCARLGCLAGRELVQILGAELTEERWEYIKKCVSQNMFKVQDKNNLKEKKTVSLNYTGTQIQSIAV